MREKITTIKLSCRLLVQISIKLIMGITRQCKHSKNSHLTCEKNGDYYAVLDVLRS